MSVTVTYECGGCFATEKRLLHRHFRSFDGKGWGFGVYEFDTPQSVAPDGWQVFDAYTGACYCPKCWAEIEDGPASEIEGVRDDLREIIET